MKNSEQKRTKKCECPSMQHPDRANKVKDSRCNNFALVRVERKISEGNYVVLDICGNCEIPLDTFVESLERA